MLRFPDFVRQIVLCTQVTLISASPKSSKYSKHNCICLLYVCLERLNTVFCSLASTLRTKLPTQFAYILNNLQLYIHSIFLITFCHLIFYGFHFYYPSFYPNIYVYPIGIYLSQYIYMEISR